MRTLIKFDSIYNYHAVKDYYKQRVQYVGRDDNNEVVYDTTIKLPKLKFEFTEKLHGENMSTVFSPDKEMTVQSRKSVLVDGPNYEFIMNNEGIFHYIRHTFMELTNNEYEDSYVTFFGEMIGDGIKRKSAGTNMERTFVLFDYVKISSTHPSSHPKYKSSYYVKDHSVRMDLSIARIFFISDYYKKTIEIDFTDDVMESKLNDIVLNNIEGCSPFAKEIDNLDNIGEGVVGAAQFQDTILFLKVKGNKHSKKARVKRKLPPEPTQSDFLAEEISHEWRFDQFAEQLLVENGGVLDKTFVREFVRECLVDTRREEIAKIESKGFTWDQVEPKLKNIASRWFVNWINENKPPEPEYVIIT